MSDGETMRLEGPVILIQSDTDPGDMGEPREFWDDEDKAMCIVVPSFDLWWTNPRSLRPVSRLVQGEPGVHDDEPRWTAEELAEWRQVLASKGAPLTRQGRRHREDGA